MKHKINFFIAIAAMVFAAAVVLVMLAMPNKMPDKRIYQTSYYEVEYDSRICSPTYENEGNCEKPRGEIWLFKGYDYKKSKSICDDIEKGKPIVMALESFWGRYLGIDIDVLDYKDNPNEFQSELLKKTSRYFHKKIEAGGNKVTKEKETENGMDFWMEDGSRAKVKVQKCKGGAFGHGYVYMTYFCQLPPEKGDLNHEIECMFDGFKRRESGNVLVDGNIAGVKYSKYKGTDVKKHSSDAKDFSVEKDMPKGEWVVLERLPMNEISKKEYEDWMEQAKDICKIRCYELTMENGEKRGIVIYFSGDGYGYTKYNGKYYVITDNTLV